MRYRYSIIQLIIATGLVCFVLATWGVQPRSKWERMDVGKSFQRLKEVVDTHASRGSGLGFSSSVPKAEIDKARKLVGDAPKQLFELIEICDYSTSGFFNEIEPVSVLQIPRYRKQEGWTQRNDAGPTFDGWNCDTYGCCKLDQPWRDGWIPIGNIHGHTIFIDMDPTERGIRGQVVELSIDWWQPNVLGYSIAHWLERAAEQGEKHPDFLGPMIYDEFVKLPPPRD